jgi:hypothetical protein
MTMICPPKIRRGEKLELLSLIQKHNVTFINCTTQKFKITCLFPQFKLYKNIKVTHLFLQLMLCKRESGHENSLSGLRNKIWI